MLFFPKFFRELSPTDAPGIDKHSAKLREEFHHQHNLPVDQEEQHPDLACRTARTFYPKLYQKLLKKFDKAYKNEDINTLTQLVEFSKKSIKELHNLNVLMIQFAGYEKQIKKGNRKKFDKAILTNIEQAKHILLKMSKVASSTTYESKPSKNSKKSSRVRLIEESTSIPLPPSLDLSIVVDEKSPQKTLKKTLDIFDSSQDIDRYRIVLLRTKQTIPATLDKNTIYLIQENDILKAAYWGREDSIIKNELDGHANNVLIQLLTGKKTLTEAKSNITYPLCNYIRRKVTEKDLMLSELDLAILIKEFSLDTFDKAVVSKIVDVGKPMEIDKLFVSLRVVQNFLQCDKSFAASEKKDELSQLFKSLPFSEFIIDKSDVFAVVFEKLFTCLLEELTGTGRYWMSKSAMELIPGLNLASKKREPAYQFIQELITPTYDKLTKLPVQKNAEEKRVIIKNKYQLYKFTDEFLQPLKQYIKGREKLLTRLFDPAPEQKTEDLKPLDACASVVSELLVITPQDIADYNAPDKRFQTKLRSTSIGSSILKLATKTDDTQAKEKKNLEKLQVLARIWVQNVELLPPAQSGKLSLKVAQLKTLYIPAPGEPPVTVQQLVTILTETAEQAKIYLIPSTLTSSASSAEEKEEASRSDEEEVAVEPIEQSIQHPLSEQPDRTLTDLQDKNAEKRESLTRLQIEIERHNEAVTATYELLRSCYDVTPRPREVQDFLNTGGSLLKVEEIKLPPRVRGASDQQTTLQQQTNLTIQNAELEGLLAVFKTKLRMHSTQFEQQTQQIGKLEQKQKEQLETLTKESKPLQINNDTQRSKLADLNNQVKAFARRIGESQKVALSLDGDLAQAVASNHPIIANIQVLSAELKQLLDKARPVAMPAMLPASDSKNLAVQIAEKKHLLEKLPAENLQLEKSWLENLKLLPSAQDRLAQLNRKLQELQEQVPQWKELQTLQTETKELTLKNTAARQRILELQHQVHSQHEKVKQIIKSVQDLFRQNHSSDQQSVVTELAELKLTLLPETTQIPEAASTAPLQEQLDQQSKIKLALSVEGQSCTELEAKLREQLTGLQEKLQQFTDIEQAQRRLLEQRKINEDLRRKIAALNAEIKIHNGNPQILILQGKVNSLVDEKAGYPSLLSTEHKNSETLVSDYHNALDLQARCAEFNCQNIDLSEFKLPDEDNSFAAIRTQNEELTRLISSHKSSLSMKKHAIGSANATVASLQEKLQRWQQTRNDLVAEIKRKTDNLNSRTDAYNDKTGTLNTLGRELKELEIKYDELKPLSRDERQFSRDIASLQLRTSQLDLSIATVNAAESNLNTVTTRLTEEIKSAELQYQSSFLRIQRAGYNHNQNYHEFARIHDNLYKDAKLEQLEFKQSASPLIAIRSTLQQRIPTLKTKRGELITDTERLQAADEKLLTKIRTFKEQHPLEQEQASLQILITQTKERLREYDSLWSILCPWKTRQSDSIHNLILNPSSHEEIKTAVNQNEKIVEVATRDATDQSGVQAIYIRILVLATRLKNNPDLTTILQFKQTLSQACAALAADGNYVQLATKRLSWCDWLFNSNHIKEKRAAAQTAVKLHDFIDIAKVHDMKPSFGG